MKKIILLVLITVFAPVNAQIYQWKDADGETHFSDRPLYDKASAKTIEIAPPPEVYYAVKRVYDGDTIQLEDGRSIRFLAINTPEIAHFGRPADMGGIAAKTWLENKLDGVKVRLEFDGETTDHYGRSLAYVFTEHNENLNVQLVAAGLAVMNIYPTSLRYVKELTEVQDLAQQAKRGIWQQTQYAVIPASQITQDGEYAGWMRITGKVQNVYKAKKYTYLNFTDNFAARIDSSTDSLFPPLDSYLGKTLEVRGWLNKSKRGYAMLIRHPSAIKLH